MYTNFVYVYSSLLFVYLFYFVLTVLAKSVTGFLKPPSYSGKKPKKSTSKQESGKQKDPAQQSASKSAENKAKKKEI